MRNKNLKRKNLLSFEKLESRAMMAITPVIPPDVFDSFPFNNDTQGAAGPLGQISGLFTLPNLTMEDSYDWFSFSMPVQGDASSFVQIDFSHFLGDLNMSLYTERGTRIRSSSTTTDVERFSIENLAAVDPSGLPITYYIKVAGVNRAKNPNYTLTIRTALGPFIDPPSKSIDLVGGGFSADDSAMWGQEINVAARVKNLGTANTATNSTGNGVQVSFYLSRDSKYSADDVLLPLVNYTPTLNFPAIAAKSTSAQKTARLTLPTDIPNGWSGTFFYVVASVDAPNLVVETNELNNGGQAGRSLDWEPISIFAPLETPQASYYNIKLSPSAGMTPQQLATFKTAAARWQKIIIGDLPNVQTSPGVIVDDILITIQVVYIDGAGGTIVSAGPTMFRDQSLGGLPVTGSLIFDLADVVAMEGEGTFLNTVTHEMGHVFGIGNLWSSFGLIQGEFGPRPTYVGPNGVAGYNKVSGFAPVSAIPIEVDGGVGVAYQHWDEDLMQNELMTGFYGPTQVEPISAVTVGSLADLGYKVNFNAAEPYNMQQLPKRVSGTLVPFPDPPFGGQGTHVPPAQRSTVTTTSRTASSSASTSSTAAASTASASSVVTSTSFVTRNSTASLSAGAKAKETDNFFGSLGI